MNFLIFHILLFSFISSSNKDENNPVLPLSIESTQLERSNIISRLLLVSTLDGCFYAFDKYTGSLYWENEELGNLLTGNMPSNTDSPLYIIEPYEDGNIFVHLPGSTIKKLPFTVQYLVNHSPVQWPDGSFFLGRKTTTFLAIDLSTGKLVFSFSTDTENKPSEEILSAFSGDSRNLILLSRNDYGLSAYPHDWVDVAQTSWNATYSCIDGIVSFFDSDPISSQALFNDNQLFYSSFNGIIIVKDEKTGQIMWMRKLPSVATKFFKMVEPLDYSLGSDSQGPIAVSLPIESNHSKNYFDGKNEKINIGILDSQGRDILFILSESIFPHLKLSFSDALLTQINEKIPLHPPSKQAKDFSVEKMVTSSQCRPGHHSFPDCIIGKHSANILSPIPLLPSFSSTRSELERSVKRELLPTFLAIIFGAFLIWILLYRLGFIGINFNRNVPRSNNVDRPPPGFEEISISTADNIYAGNHVKSDHSLPLSFTVTDEVVGYGSHGTVVFKGFYDGRAVAVKRLLVNFFDIAGHEVELLQQSDFHPNVIRCFCKETTQKFIFIVLELCKCSLADYIESQKCAPIAPKLILEQITKGLLHLHAMKVVHRDIKPQNILQSESGKFVISDFGLGKRLADNQSSFHPTIQAGTVGWRASECILADEANKLSSITKKPPNFKLSKSIDIFALGCVFYYVLTNGQHPYGSRLHREVNISNDNSDISLILESEPEAANLIRKMISHVPSNRPTCGRILNHPFFWPSSKRIAFLQDVSDLFEFEDRKEFSEILKSFESRKKSIFQGNLTWPRQLDAVVWEDLIAFRNYNGHLARDLLRALRNKSNHFQEMAPAVRNLLGHTKESLMNYFFIRFPTLLIECYSVIEASSAASTPPFSTEYYSEYNE